MNILVTGANGQLGNEMRRVCAGSSDRYIFTDVAELDITDFSAVSRMVTEEKVDVIVNCAAYTNVDKAEEDSEFAEILNAEAPRNLARAAKARGAWLIHISTDYVFGGSQGNTPRNEEEAVNPTGVYGLTKLHGEQAIKEEGCRHIIIRTAWLYSEYGNNFLLTMRRLTGSKRALNVVFDQVGTPTYALDLARAISHIIVSGLIDKNIGTYHFSNEGVCSWYDFTKAIAETCGNTDCEISPCHSDEFPSKVVRPSYSVLDKSKIKETFGVTVPYWVDSLKECVANLGNEG